MRKYTGVVFTDSGGVQPFTPVLVIYSGTETPASLFADDEQSAIANPVVADESGQFTFKVRSGIFDFIDNNNDEKIQVEVQIFDFKNPGEWVGLWTFADTGIRFGETGNRNLYTVSESQMAFDCGLRVGGAVGDNPTLVLLAMADGTGDLFQAQTFINDLNPFFTLSRTGTIGWGLGGGSAIDLTLARNDVNELRSSGGLILDAGKLHHKGTLAGFFGADPITQPIVSGEGEVLDNVSDRSLINLLVALQKLGLISYSVTLAAQGKMSVVTGATLTAIIRGVGLGAMVSNSTAGAVIKGDGTFFSAAAGASTTNAVATGTVS